MGGSAKIQGFSHVKEIILKKALVYIVFAPYQAIA